jgi:hypothetical protein
MSSRHGYKNPFLLVTFPDLADGASVLIRNPNLMPPAKLQQIVTASQGAETSEILTAPSGMSTWRATRISLT